MVCFRRLRDVYVLTFQNAHFLMGIYHYYKCAVFGWFQLWLANTSSTVNKQGTCVSQETSFEYLAGETLITVAMEMSYEGESEEVGISSYIL